MFASPSDPVIPMLQPPLIYLQYPCWSAKQEALSDAGCACGAALSGSRANRWCVVVVADIVVGSPQQGKYKKY
jgi:hypothetical protein